MSSDTTLDRLAQISHALTSRYPDGNEPFQMMTRLLEECGELAQQVNHFEGSGIKHSKHGEPDTAKMAKEVMDILRCVFQIVEYYELQGALEISIEQSYQHWLAAGWIQADANSSSPAKEAK